MITREMASSWLASANVKAMFRVIRSGESWNDDENPGSEHDEKAFRVRYAGWNPETRRYNPRAFFDSFDDHPRIFELTPTGKKSSASGAFQIVATTWDDLRRQFPWLGPKFTPFEQMLAAALLMYRRGALDDVIDGRLEEAVAKCGKEWASLPGSTLEDGGSELEWERVRAVWKRWGGGVPRIVAVSPGDSPAPAPIEEKSTQARPEDVARILAAERAAKPKEKEADVAPVLLTMLPAIMQAITQAVPALATLFGKNAEKVQDKIEAASAIVDIVTTATGSVNAQEAVEKIAADPQVAAKAKAAVLSDPVVMMMLGEAGGGGIDGARAFVTANANNPQTIGILSVVTYWVLGFLTFANVAGFAMAGILAWNDRDEWQQIVSTLIQADINAAFAAVGFWLGSSLVKGQSAPSAPVR